MGKWEKVLSRVLSGRADAGVRFSDLCNLLRQLGFEGRTRGSHHVFVLPGVEDLINLQRDGGTAKPYQVRQVRKILTRHGIGSDD